jgi:hypothetical protein
MQVNPVLTFLGTSAWTGLVARDDAFASLALRPFLSIPTSIEREDNWT